MLDNKIEQISLKKHLTDSRCSIFEKLLVDDFH